MTNWQVWEAARLAWRDAFYALIRHPFHDHKKAALRSRYDTALANAARAYRIWRRSGEPRGHGLPR